MPMPTDIGVIDLMLAVPGDDTSHFYEWIKPMLMDKESHEMFKMPAQYMFKDIPETPKQDDYIAYTLDHYGRRFEAEIPADISDLLDALAAREGTK